MRAQTYADMVEFFAPKEWHMFVFAIPASKPVPGIWVTMLVYATCEQDCVWRVWIASYTSQEIEK